MNEVDELVQAFDAATMRGERCVLATVVSVDGSSYRRPGARMLVSETGASTGTISAGCLESDVIEHCRGVIEAAKPKLLEYDTASTAEEMAWGLGLGCGGIVCRLVEPLASPSPYLEALRRSREARSNPRPLTIVTVYRCTQSELVPGPRSRRFAMVTPCSGPCVNRARKNRAARCCSGTVPART
jgi:xanthine dehydrogenase accessory factor